VATKTRRFVALVEAVWKRAGGTGPAPGVYHTRKTSPLFRDLEREAIVSGGGRLHRRDLADSVLFKENHKEVLRGEGLSWADLVTTLGGARVKTSLIEVENPAEARAVVDAGARLIMLDNFSPSQVRETVAGLPADVTVEVSGGLDFETIVDFVIPGVHRLSVGSLTHSAPSLDLSLDWVGEAGA
jgi:nicotinate-nucleotide pyrophosphorylase (carboxylating)